MAKNKIVSLQRLKKLLASARKKDITVVFTNGCFDIIHAGHVRYLNEPTPIRLIKAALPDVLVKGADWADHAIVGADVVKKAGGRIARIKLVKGRSTTNIIKKILELHQ